MGWIWSLGCDSEVSPVEVVCQTVVVGQGRVCSASGSSVGTCGGSLAQLAPMGSGVQACPAGQAGSPRRQRSGVSSDCCEHRREEVSGQRADRRGVVMLSQAVAAARLRPRGSLGTLSRAQPRHADGGDPEAQ